MDVIVGEKIIVRNPTQTIERWCKEFLTLDNPDFYKRERMGKSTWNIPRTIVLYEQVGGELWLPFGCLQKVWSMCVRGVRWKLEICPIKGLQYHSNIKLYDYQEAAVSAAIQKKNGVLVMPCGSGKTQCGLEIIARIGGRALWLTHTQDLLNQSKKRAESVLSQGGYGTITAGRVNIGTHITFATVQTMAKINLQAYRDAFDVVIVDECQHCCGTPTKITQFYRVVSSLRARYKIGLTATPKRADGLERGMFALLGGIMHEVTREQVAHTTCPIRVQKVATGWQPNYECVLMGDGTIDYNKVIDDMTHDDGRFACVFGFISYIPQGQAAIVLANRVEYLKTMCDVYNDGQFGSAVCLSGAGQSKAAKNERKKALQALNNGELDVIFATYQLAKEGLDVPNLRYVVLATPEKDETTVIQSAGRVGRKADGKEYGTVVDFVDNFGMYYGWANKRDGYYKKIGAEII